MKREDLVFFKVWFSDYTSSFQFADKKARGNIQLKEKHTMEVCANIVLLAKELSLDSGKLMLAESIGLFHDIGRFRQYEKYRTFRDSISENHAALGVAILAENGILEKLAERERQIILSSVRFHNAFAVPDLQDDEILLFLKLIRDADKLDIFRVFSEYYESPAEERASAVGLDLPDIPGYSRDVLSCIFEKRIASLSSLRTLNDFKLMKLSWVYDFNFKSSLRLLRERRYISRLLETLPRTDELNRAISLLEDHIEKRLAGKDPSEVNG